MMSKDHYEWARAEERALARYVNPEDLPAEFKLPPDVNRLDVLAEQKGKGIAQLLYNRVCEQNIQYDLAPFNPRFGIIQSIRKPATILAEKRGTCLDLAVLFAAMCLNSDLLPLVVVVDGHAFAGLSLTRTRRDDKKAPQALAWDKGKLVDLSLLQELAGPEYLFIECTGATQSKKALSSKEGDAGFPEKLKRGEDGRMSFERACEAGREQLLQYARLAESAANPNQRVFLYALDIHDLQVKQGFEPVKDKTLTLEQVNLLLAQISATFQPKPFDGRCPYRGLEAFGEEDSEYFFGREKVVADLASRVEQARFLVITGPSGNGKSSLVRAGLIPAFKRGALTGSEHWPHTILTPGRNPLDALANITTKLGGTTTAGDEIRTKGMTDVTVLHHWVEAGLGPERQRRAVIVVDQFEEMFTQVAQEAERAAFLNLLMYAATAESGRVTVLFVLRSDFVSNCALYPALNDLINKPGAFFQVGAMQPDELVSAIARPALQVGLRIDPDLITQIINDMQGEPGVLPLMQFALKDLFDDQQRAGGVIALTRDGYLARGGLHKALERHADRAFNQLDPAEQALAPTIFAKLVQPGRGKEDTRRTATFEELVPPGAPATRVEAIIRRLAEPRLRLITTDERDEHGTHIRTATIAHEKLIDAWPWLRRLVNDNREAIALQNEITDDAQAWEQSRRDSSYLYTGARLATAREKLAAKQLALSMLAQTFVDASLEAEEAARRAEKAHQQAELKKERQNAARLRARNRIITAVGIIALIAAVAAGIFGYRSNQNARLSSARELAAHAVSSLGIDPELSLMLGMQSIHTIAVDKVVLPEAEDSLHRALGQVHILRTLSGSAAPLSQAVFSPDGKRVATAGDDAVAQIWDLRQTGAEMFTLTGHSDQVSSVAFSPDGHYLATASWDDTVKIWELSTGQELFTLSGHEDDVYFVAFSPLDGGQSLATASGDGTVKIWDITTGQEISTLGDPETLLFALAFSPDGQRLAASGDEGTALVWDIMTGEKLLTLATGNTDAVNQIVFSPDGSTLATAGYDHTVRLWDAETGQSLFTLTGHTDSVVGLSFSHDGQRLATAGTDASIKIWDVPSGGLSLTLAGHQKEVTKVDFSPDGQQLVSSSRDGTVKIWNVSPESGQELVTARAHTGTIYQVVYSPDSRRFATASRDGTAHVWDSATGQSVLDLTPAAEAPEIYSVAFTPDGKQLVTGGCDEFDDEGNCLAGTVTRWDATTGQAVSSFLAHQDAASDLAISPDGQKLVTASWDGTAKLWDLNLGTEIVSVTAPNEGTLFNRIAFSPDATTVAITSYDEADNVFLWNTSSGDLTTLTGHVDQGFGVAFSPDGKQLATASQDGTAILWDVATGKALQTFQGHSGGVQGVAFSPDGKRLATASIDKTVMLWDVATGRKLVTLYGHTDQVWSVAFSPNGQQLATASADQTVRRYILPINNLLELVQSRLTRWFSPAECDKFFPQVACPSAP